jgi:hypothetical protein
MKSRIVKAQILEACIQKQHGVIDNLSKEAEMNSDTLPQIESARVKIRGR